jgi:molecular chaperone Hsp33
LKQWEQPGAVALRRYINSPRSIVITTGDFTSLLASWERNAELWESHPDPLSTVMMRQALAGAACHLANRPRDETVAWTVNIVRPATVLFVTGDARKSTITGRVYTEGVKPAPHSRLFAQVVRPEREPFESIVEVEGLDILGIFEQYYLRSEQNPARFFELASNGDEREGPDQTAPSRFAMVLAMPGADRSWLADLGRESIAGLVRESVVLERRIFRFECGCSPQRMLSALRGIFEKNPEELFRGENEVEAFCPRCGRRWMVSKEQFFAA